jgi:DNA-binding YbaB/EbfC family protein
MSPPGPFGGGPGDLDAILRQAQQARQGLEDARAALRRRQVEGRAGGGMVVATCDGTGDLVRVRFEPGLLSREDPSVVEDLVVAAVRDARRRASEAEREAYAEAAGGLFPGLGAVPGFSDLLDPSPPPSPPPRKPPSAPA